MSRNDSQCLRCLLHDAYASHNALRCNTNIKTDGDSTGGIHYDMWMRVMSYCFRQMVICEFELEMATEPVRGIEAYLVTVAWGDTLHNKTFRFPKAVKPRRAEEHLGHTSNACDLMSNVSAS
jgi:hypothetical protein